ncbi:MAG: hypothetical protein AB7O24_30670 [Kofleriaceae bacterium]
MVDYAVMGVMSFRETAWFKKGELASKVADGAASPEDAALDGDQLPVEDRYGATALAPGDTLAYGVHTGETQGMPPVERPANAGVNERVLIGEMKRTRRAYLLAIACCVAVLAIALLLMR